jgi:protein SCO1/2
MTTPGILSLLILVLVLPASAHDESQSRVYPGINPIADKVAIEQRLDTRIPLELTFADESGQTVSLSRYFDGKPVLLALVYYNCDRLCPLVLEGLARSLRPLDLRAGKDYRVVAVSIDPHEAPALANEKKRLITSRYARLDGNHGWHLLTGTQPAIDALASAIGFRYAIQPTARSKDRFIHAAATVMITPQGKVSRYFYGIDYPPRDLRLSMIEASGNRIGSVVDQLLLLCYAYDPAQGKYTLSIMKWLRLSGTATVLALGGFLVLMVRRDRSGRAGREERNARARP